LEALVFNFEPPLFAFELDDFAFVFDPLLFDFELDDFEPDDFDFELPAFDFDAEVFDRPDPERADEPREDAASTRVSAAAELAAPSPAVDAAAPTSSSGRSPAPLHSWLIGPPESLAARRRSRARVFLTHAEDVFDTEATKARIAIKFRVATRLCASAPSALRAGRAALRLRAR
jgi:hypothetical protein